MSFGETPPDEIKPFPLIRPYGQFLINHNKNLLNVSSTSFVHLPTAAAGAVSILDNFLKNAGSRRERWISPLTITFPSVLCIILFSPNKTSDKVSKKNPPRGRPNVVLGPGSGGFQGITWS